MLHSMNQCFYRHFLLCIPNVSAWKHIIICVILMCKRVFALIFCVSDSTANKHNKQARTVFEIPSLHPQELSNGSGFAWRADRWSLHLLQTEHYLVCKTQESVNNIYHAFNSTFCTTNNIALVGHYAYKQPNFAKESVCVPTIRSKHNCYNCNWK